MCQKWKPGPGVLFKTKKLANTGLFLFLITVQTLGKKKNLPLLPNPFCGDFVVLLVLRPCRAPRPTSLRRLARSVSAVRIALHAGVRTSQIALSISACFSSHCTPFFSPPFFIMLSHVNPSSSLNAVHFWVHSNVIVCCSSSLFFFFLSITFHCQRFYLGFLFSTAVCLFVCFLFFALADVYCYILSGFFVFLFFFVVV